MPPNRLKNICKFFLKFCVSLALLGYFLSRVDLTLVIGQITHFPKGILILICLLYLIPQFINTFKWRLLLYHYSFSSLFQMTILGQYYNLILPGQIVGEGVKAYKLGKSQQDAEQVAASVAVDKITAFIGLLLVGIFGAALSRSQIHYGIVVALCLIVAVFSFSLFFFRFQTIRDFPGIILTRFFESSPRTGRLAGQLRSFMEAWLTYSRQTTLIFYSILLGVLFQLVVAVITDFLARQLGIVVSLIDWCWIMPIATIAVLLPVTIGGIGVREGSFITMLGWLGVSDDKALALSLMCLFIQILFAVWGLFLDLNWHLRFTRNGKGEHKN
jgi:uncharacterized protein (TIRG00374 family)